VIEFWIDSAYRALLYYEESIARPNFQLVKRQMPDRYYWATGIIDIPYFDHSIRLDVESRLISPRRARNIKIFLAGYALVARDLASDNVVSDLYRFMKHYGKVAIQAASWPFARELHPKIYDELSAIHELVHEADGTQLRRDRAIAIDTIVNYFHEAAQEELFGSNIGQLLVVKTFNYILDSLQVVK